MTQRDPDHQNRGKNGTTLELIERDLNFLVPLLRKWPKCYWIWNYRVWLLQEATLRLDPSVARRLWEADLGLVAMMLVKDNRNFHGWRYRRILVAQLESEALKGTSMVESEFEYTTKMIKANLSNFSAWHNRSKLIPQLLDERKADDAARRKFLDDGKSHAKANQLSAKVIIEFDIMTNALWVDPTDQSLWFYHQFLMTTLIDPTAHKVMVPNFTQEDRIEYVERQLANLIELLDGAEDCKWIYNALIDSTTSLWRMKGNLPPQEVKENLRTWLAELRKLDPIRHGRWGDMEKSLQL
jgi:geranylgeranyl transferase type-2 subunit alpha